MKMIMTGLDYKRSDLSVREKFAVTKAVAAKLLAGFSDMGVGGCAIISTCNRTEVYASIPDDGGFLLSETLCAALGVDFSEYESFFTQRDGYRVMEHLCRVACGLDSQITGDDQIITQVREALELSRSQKCTDSYTETMFNMAIHAAKAIKTDVLANLPQIGSVAEKTVEKIKTMCNPAGKNALVIGNGKIGRTVAELLVRENMNVAVTLRSHKRGAVQIPHKVSVINYDERYNAAEKSDIIISATASPHLTLLYGEVSALKKKPNIIIDLAVPRDVEPSVKSITGVTLLTIDDISGEKRLLSPQSAAAAENIIAEHIAKYDRWLSFKENKKRVFFPLFVDMNGRKALIVGGGNVAERRLKILVSFGADITVISPEIGEYIERAASTGSIRLIKRKYEKGDIADVSPFLVIAAADERQVNRLVITEAKDINIHVSAADCREECTFYFPAIAENDDYVAGLVSKTGDHAGVKRTAEKIRELFAND